MIWEGKWPEDDKQIRAMARKRKRNLTARRNEAWSIIIMTAFMAATSFSMGYYFLIIEKYSASIEAGELVITASAIPMSMIFSSMGKRSLVLIFIQKYLFMKMLWTALLLYPAITFLVSFTALRYDFHVLVIRLVAAGIGLLLICTDWRRSYKWYTGLNP